MANGTSKDNLYYVSMKYLSTKTSKLICESLNTLMILPAENGLLRDWRGIAELLKINISQFECYLNPAEKLFQLAQNAERDKYTVQELVTSLEELDRFDIIDDYKDLIENDLKQYNTIQNEIETVSISVAESYDAMVLYDEKDADFAYNLVDIMEKNYNLKLFVKDRNLKAGDKEVQGTLSVIADQSNKLIVLLSPEFLASPMNEFFLDYAQTIAIEQKVRKIVPCMLTRCELPKQLVGLHTLTFSTNCRWGNFWSRLADSIDPGVISGLNCVQQSDIKNTASLLDCSKSSSSSKLSINNNLSKSINEVTHLKAYSSTSKYEPVFKNINDCNVVCGAAAQFISPTHAPSASSTLDANLIGSKSHTGSHKNTTSKEKSSKHNISKRIFNQISKVMPKKVKKNSSKKEKIAVAL